MKRVNTVSDTIKRQQYEEASLLLPWYITDKLSQTESEKVDAVLKVSLELQSDLVRQLEISEMIKEDPDVLDLTAISSQERRLDSLIERIDNSPSVISTSDSKSLLQKLSEKFHLSRPSLSARASSVRMSNTSTSKRPWLANHRWQVVFSLFVVAQVAVLAIVMNKSDNSLMTGTEYELAGVESAYVSSDQAILTFQFENHADKEVIEKLFEKIGAEIVEHSEGSVNYKVFLKGDRSEQEIESLIRDLEKQSDLILLVGRGAY